MFKILLKNRLCQRKINYLEIFCVLKSNFVQYEKCVNKTKDIRCGRSGWFSADQER